jgi:phosphatidylglycerol:prolipoprotein diacylglycerol transferase
MAITWNVSPELVDIGFLHLRWYGVLFATGIVVGFQIVRKILISEGVPENDAEPLLTYSVLGTVIGARLGHVFFYEPEVFLADPIRIFKVWEGGLASHGGVIGLCFAIWLYCRKMKLPYLWLLDRACVGAAVTSMFIRLGNLMNSEIIGRPTHSSWGFIFTSIDNQPRHPAQLYESIFYLGVYFMCRYFYKSTKIRSLTGVILGSYLSSIFIFRFLVEFIKEDQVAKEVGMTLNIGQLLSIPTVAVGLFFIYWGIKKGEQHPYTPTSSAARKK